MKGASDTKGAGGASASNGQRRRRGSRASTNTAQTASDAAASAAISTSSVHVTSADDRSNDGVSCGPRPAATANRSQQDGGASATSSLSQTPKGRGPGGRKKSACTNCVGKRYKCPNDDDAGCLHRSGVPGAPPPASSSSSRTQQSSNVTGTTAVTPASCTPHDREATSSRARSLQSLRDHSPIPPPSILRGAAASGGTKAQAAAAASTVPQSASDGGSGTLAVRPRTAPPPLVQLALPGSLVPCVGAYSNYFGSMLTFAAKSMVSTAHTLLGWARMPDCGVNAFAQSAYAKTRDLLLPYYKFLLRRAPNPSDGFVLHSEECANTVRLDGSRRGKQSQRCEECTKKLKKASNVVNERTNARRGKERPLPHPNTPIDKILTDTELTKRVIVDLRAQVKQKEKEKARAVYEKKILEEGIKLKGARAIRVQKAVEHMSPHIEGALEKSGDTEALTLWQIQRERMNKIYANGGVKRGRKVEVHPVILNWAIAFLARTSATVYEEVRKIMLLPDLRYIQRKSRELVSRGADKAFSMCIATMHTMQVRAKEEGWSEGARTGCISLDSANINAGIEHDLVSNQLVGGDESHRLAGLSQMFHVMAQEVKKASDEDENPSQAESEKENPKQNNASILDNLRLAKEHLVFKFTSTDPEIDCSEVVASINVEKVTPQIVTHIFELLRDTLPIFGFKVACATADAAGSNWQAFKSMADHSVRDLLPKEITEDRESYKDIDFDLQIVHKNPVTGEFILFLPDMPHLIKNIVTALELSGKQSSKRDLKFGRCPMQLKMIEQIWRALGGDTTQLQWTKLTGYHFDKNAYSRMNVALAMQILSASVAAMIRMAIADESVVGLPFRNKDIYSHLATFCDHMNTLVDICNGRDGPFTPFNARNQQKKLLAVLQYLSEWKKHHDERVEKGEANEYNFFADETYFCMRALILAQVATIELHCIQLGRSIHPRRMNTDVVEWFFGDCRQFVGGSTDKLTARGWNVGDFKASACRAGKHKLQGNNATGGEGAFKKRRKW